MPVADDEIPAIGPKAKEPTPEEKAAAEADETARIADEDARALAGDQDAIAAKKKRETVAAPPAAKPGDKKADDAAAADDDDAPADEFAAPKGLKERSAKRWEGLVKRTKNAEGVASEWDRVMRATGAPPETIAGAFEIIRLMHSGTDDGLREALKRIENQRAAIARNLGEEVPGVDLLVEHADLQKEVDGMTLTRERALEIARGRNKAKRDQDHQAAVRTQDETKTRRDSAVGKAKVDLAKRQEELTTNDLDFEPKYHYMMKSGIFDDIAKSFPPEKWLERFNLEYGRIPKEVLKAPAAAGKGKIDAGTGKEVATGTPLRAGTGAAGKPGAPKDMLDAVERSLLET